MLGAFSIAHHEFSKSFFSVAGLGGAVSTIPFPVPSIRAEVGESEAARKVECAGGAVLLTKSSGQN